uniref:Uncharacterized protein n=1 Tax=Arundo donax TaxID=35708 RepID=A0A0A9DUC7_ARUDO
MTLSCDEPMYWRGFMIQLSMYFSISYSQWATNVEGQIIKDAGSLSSFRARDSAMSLATIADAWSVLPSPMSSHKIPCNLNRLRNASQLIPSC